MVVELTLTLILTLILTYYYMCTDKLDTSR